MNSTTTRNPEKAVDLPPYGDRNPDPMTDSPGSHPIETGLGAVAGGAASGLAVGMVAGPVGAAIGAAVGAIAGGLAGKGVGELIDPTTEDNWIRDYYRRDDRTPLETEIAGTRSAFRFGVRAEAEHPTKSFTQAAPTLAAQWDSGSSLRGRPWAEVKEVVRSGFEKARDARTAHDSV